MPLRVTRAGNRSGPMGLQRGQEIVSNVPDQDRGAERKLGAPAKSMKIIKEGEWKQSVTCRGCSSKLQFDANDIEFGQEMQEDESFALSFYIHCPKCSRRIVQRNLPEKIKEEVTTRGC